LSQKVIPPDIVLFKYLQRQTSKGKNIDLPYIDVTFKNGKKIIPVMALIDSGADITILPIEIAGVLGIELNIKEKIKLHAAGGSTFPVYPSPGKVECIIEQKGFRPIVLKSKVYFAESAPTILLGHHDFLYQLKIILDGPRKEVEITK